MRTWLLTTRELEKHFERSERCLSILAGLDFSFSWALWIVYGAPSEYIMLSCAGMFFVISGPSFLSLSRCICLKFPLNAQFLLEALPWKPSFLPMFSVGLSLAASFPHYPRDGCVAPSPVVLGTDWILSQPLCSAAPVFSPKTERGLVLVMERVPLWAGRSG